MMKKTKIKITINGQICSGTSGQTILEIAEANGIRIPNLCHNKELKHYGGCSLCVVEAENSPKLLRACSSIAADGQVIYTESERVVRTRKTSIELLMSDHEGDCVAPCSLNCPAHTDIQGYLKQIALGNDSEAVKIIKEKISIPASIGRICPHPCESNCRRRLVEEPLSVAYLKAFAADNDLASDDPYTAVCEESTGKKVAVIGSGPAGLTCAGDLAKKGYDVTVFEALHLAGGVLVYGIPEFRLPKDIVKYEIDNLKALGVKIETNMVIGKILSVDELISMGYEAIFIGSGAGLPLFMGIEGEDASGVFSANEYLTRSNLMKAFNEDSTTPIMRGKKVAVVGGGNVAMDAARTALRLGAEVHIVYRRSEEELPARVEEVHHAKEEGIIFDLLTNPIEILEDENNWVKGMKCVKMALGEPDASGRRKPVEVEGSEFEMELDTVIMSLGTSPNPLISSTTEGLETNKWKCIVADEEFGKTTKEGVFAGGDAVTGAATVILAMGAGRAAAKGIDEYLSR